MPPPESTLFRLVVVQTVADTGCRPYRLVNLMHLSTTQLCSPVLLPAPGCSYQPVNAIVAQPAAVRTLLKRWTTRSTRPPHLTAFPRARLRMPMCMAQQSAVFRPAAFASVWGAL